MRRKVEKKSLLVLICMVASAFAPIFFASVTATVTPNAIAPKAGVNLEIIVSDQQKPGIDGVIPDFLASPLGSGVSNVTVIASGTRANDQLTYLITQMTAGSTEFDVLGLDPTFTAQFAANNWIINMDSYFNSSTLNNYVPGIVQACMYNGHLYAFPYFMNLGMLFYRKDILARNGFNASDITTWAGLNATARAILDNVTEQHMNPNLYGYVGQFDAYEGGVCNFFEWLGSAGSTPSTWFDSSGMATLNNTQARRAMDFLAGLVAPRYTGVMNTSYIIPRDALTTDEGSSVGAWLAGNVLFMRQWTFAYGNTIADSLLNATDGGGNYTQFGIVPIPTFDGTTSELSSVVGGAVLAIPTSSLHKEAALNLTKFLGMDEAQRYELTSISNFPALKSVYDTPPIGFNWIKAFIPALNKTMSRPINAQYSSISNIIAGYFSHLLTGYDTSPTALGYMDRDINELLFPSTTAPISGYDLALVLISLGAVVTVMAVIMKKKRLLTRV